MTQYLKKFYPQIFKSDSNVGISLTGGLDSRMILACRPAMLGKPICYTFSGLTGETLDDRIAAQVANDSGLEHRLLRFRSDFFSDFAMHADRTVYTTDGCFGILGAREIYLNRLGRELASVRLTGNFGSEILSGVCTFKPIELSQSLLEDGIAGTEVVAFANLRPIPCIPSHLLPFGTRRGTSLEALVLAGSTVKILGLHKYLHYRSWFRRELAEFINDVLVDARTRQMPFWNSSLLESLASDHIRGRKNYVLELNAVLTLKAVERLLLRDAGAARHTPDKRQRPN